MNLAPFTLEHVGPFLRRSRYNEPWHEPRLLATGKLLPPARSPDDLYVDLGTHPLLMHTMARLGGYRAVWGANWDPQLKAKHQDVVVEEFEPVTSKFRYRVFNVNFEFDRLPFDDGAASLVTCLEVIEHMTSDPMHLLIEINRILANGGHLVLSTPNVVSWGSVLRSAKLEHPMSFPWFFPEKYTNRHNIEYTPQMLRNLLHSAGFEGSVTTIDAWTQADPKKVEALVAAGFTDFDRGDCILATVRKASRPVVRYDPSVYQLDEPHKAMNHRVALEYQSD